MQKSFNVDGLQQPVVLTRRKGTRNLRIQLKNDGRVSVSVPYGIPEAAARVFVRSKLEWINKNLKPQTTVPEDAHIGKSHRLRVITSDATRHSTKVSETDITVNLPVQISSSSMEGQKIIKKACEKALLLEGKRLLPQRLEQLSNKTKIGYNQAVVKKLKSRWGACDNLKNITLNSYLIQLDWEVIDYVIYHELAHTDHPHHQKDFWNQVSKICPDYKSLRKILKSMPTDIIPTLF